jgi:hypothetical protein
MMVTIERLRQLVEAVPAEERATAARVLEALAGLEPGEPFYTTEMAPLDDEPETEEERAAVTEALEASARGEVVTTAELRRRFGL